MAELSREIFDKRIGEIALELGLVSPEAQARMIEIQARGIVLVNKDAEPVPSIAELNDDKIFAGLQAKYGINEAELVDARKRAAEPRTLPIPNIPPAGAVLAALPGGIDSVVKDALLAAQAAEKALRALDRARLPGTAYNDASYTAFHAQNAELLDGVKQNDFVHLARGGEASIVRSAQQIYKNAREFEAMEHHVDCAAASATDPEFLKRRQMLATTLPQLAATSYRTAAMALGKRAEVLAKAQHPEAAKIADLGDRLVTLLANESSLSVKIPTEAEMAEFSRNHPEITGTTVQKAAGLNEATKSWVEKTNRGGQQPGAQISAAV